jgi:hypothetical protein
MEHQGRDLLRAREKGVKIGKSKRSGHYWAKSTSREGVYYRVGKGGCGCPGFVSHGHCMHHAAFTEAMRKKEEG